MQVKFNNPTAMESKLVEILEDMKRLEEINTHENEKIKNKIYMLYKLQDKEEQ